MSTRFGLHIHSSNIELVDDMLPEEYKEHEFIDVAFRSNRGQLSWSSPIATLLPEDTKVYPLDNTAQGIYTIGDIKKNNNKMKEDKYIPEIGQYAFGQPFKEFKASNLMEAALRLIAEEWERIMGNIHQGHHEGNPFSNTGNKWKCDEFEIQAYSWAEDKQEYNFKWKDIEVSWYKYIGRGMSQNRDTKAAEIAEMLDACLGALKEFEKANKKY